MRRFMVHFVTEIDFVDGDEASDDMVQNYQKHRKETVQRRGPRGSAPDDQSASGRECIGAKGRPAPTMQPVRREARLDPGRRGIRPNIRACRTTAQKTRRKASAAFSLWLHLSPKVDERGLARIELVITAQIARNAAYPNPMSACLSSRQLTDTVYRPTKNSGAGLRQPRHDVDLGAKPRVAQGGFWRHAQAASISTTRLLAAKGAEHLPVRHRRPGRRHVGEVEG